MNVYPFVAVVAITVLLLGGYVLFLSFEKDDSHILRNRFASIGDPVGRTPADIIAQVGRPTSIYRFGVREIYTWTKPKYEIALLFKDGRCAGIEHESPAQLSEDT